MRVAAAIPSFRPAVMALMLASASACSVGEPGKDAAVPTAVDRDRARLELQHDIAAFALQVDAAARGDEAAIAQLRAHHARMTARLTAFDDPRSDFTQEVDPDRALEQQRNLLRSAVFNLGGHLAALEKLGPDLRRTRDARSALDQALVVAINATDGMRERLVAAGGQEAAVAEILQQVVWLQRLRIAVRQLADDEDAHNAAAAAARDFERWRLALAAQREAPWRASLLKSTTGGDELDHVAAKGEAMVPLLTVVLEDPGLTREARDEAMWAKRIYNAFPEAPGRETPPAR